MKQFFIKNKETILIIFTLFLVFGGVNFLFMEITLHNGHSDRYPAFLLAITTIGFYLVPMIFGIRYLRNRWSVTNNMPLALSWILGICATVYFGTFFHTAVGFFLLEILKAPQEFLNDWGASISAPIAEEIAKCLIVLLTLWLTREKSLKTAFLSSIIVGLGFQVTEDIVYAARAFFGDAPSGFSDLFERIANSLGTHWVFTGLFAFGIIVLMRKNLAIPKWKGIVWAAGAVALHFFWNSPFDFSGIQVVLGTAGLALLYSVFNALDTMDESAALVSEPAPQF